MFLFFFFFYDPATTEIYTLSLHDALPISVLRVDRLEHLVALLPHRPGRDDAQVHAFGQLLRRELGRRHGRAGVGARSEEHTSELQSHSDLVCRLLLEKKKKKRIQPTSTKL